MNNIEYLSKPAKVSMSDEWYDTADVNHFWMLWRFHIVKRYLSKIPNIKALRILEVGCGNGINMQLFESHLNIVVDGCDLNEHALLKIPEVKGRKIVYDIYDQHPAITDKYDIIMLFDVVEHIRDDNLFLNRIVDQLKCDGLLLINVPAKQALFSRYDTIMGHERRYSKSMLIELLGNSEVRIDHLQYWGFFLMPVLFLRKLVLLFINKKTVTIGFKPPHQFINALFKLLMRFELWLFNKPPTGTSLFVAAKKDN